MTAPIVYGKHNRANAGTPCEICGTPSSAPATDHCHDHGWVRGVVCARCNRYMAIVDRSYSPRVDRLPGEVTLAALIEHRGKCPDCPPICQSSLIDTPGPTSLRTIRISDEEWAAAKAAAEARGENVSEVIRAALRRYVKRTQTTNGQGA